MAAAVVALGAAAAATPLPDAAAAAKAPSAKAPSAKDVERAQKRANDAAGRLARAQTGLAQAERGLAQLTAQSASSGARLTSLEDQVRALALDRYVRGDDTLDWVGGQGAIGDIARRRSILRYVTSVQVDAVDGLRVARVDFDTDQDALERRLAQQRSRVADLRDEQRTVRAELDRLADAQRRYEATLAAARRARRKPAPVAGGLDVGRILGRGSWICPVQRPRAFSNDWGQPRSGGRSHKGNDILAPRGTPVVASVAGSVKANSSGLGGIAYYLKGDDGNTYYGAHLERLSVGGGRVAAGQVLGTVGTSGNARGGPPHLHFEVHPGGGRAVNPFPTLRRFC